MPNGTLSTTMKRLLLADTTLSQSDYTFKDKLHIARLLDELHVDILEFPVGDGSKQDALLVRTVASFLTYSRISVGVDSPQSLATAKAALEGCANAIIRLEVPVSTVTMEYHWHKKAPQMLQWIQDTLQQLQGYRVEVCALDATRSEQAFLAQVMQCAAQNGAAAVTLCDDAAIAMPDTFGNWVATLTKGVAIPVGVRPSNTNGLALANALVAAKNGAQLIKTTTDTKGVELEMWGTLLHNCGLNEGLQCNLDYTKLHHHLGQLLVEAPQSTAPHETAYIHLDIEDSAETVREAVIKLGYDLDDEDHALVYEEFLRVAAKKTVGAKELDAIVSSTAMQVPMLYKVESFVVNNSNLFDASAQVTLSREGVQLLGVAVADGPIAAAFAALEQIVGQHYELDEFQIMAVTEGQGAVGKATVKLREGGKLYAGTGISTDIIGAAIRAYVSAVNKIAYEEA